MPEQEQIPTDEEAERELEEAEKAFEEENKTIAAQQSGEPTKEETARENQQILAALGFKPYHDAGVTKYSIHVMNIKIGVTFNETNPLGKVWAYYIPEGDEEKKFFKNGKLAEHPLIQKYRAIQEGKEPIPENEITGKIVEKRGKAIKIEIEENGEKKEIFFGQGAVKKDNNGHFIPAGFSKAGKDKEGKEHDAKMDIPRDIRLPDYETQLEQAPAADKTKEKDVPITEAEQKVEGTKEQKPEDRERGKTEHTSMDEVIKSREETIANIMKTYLEKGREMVEQIFPELEQPQLSELSQDIATSMFIEDRKEARKERW